MIHICLIIDFNSIYKSISISCTARPSLRGACPLDVAYSSLMDNNELALALRESDLDKVAVYLSRCGQQSNQELLSKGYPDIGWDPVGGERFIDFLRFCVWVNGESVLLVLNVLLIFDRSFICLFMSLRKHILSVLEYLNISRLTINVKWRHFNSLIKVGSERHGARFPGLALVYHCKNQNTVTQYASTRIGYFV